MKRLAVALVVSSGYAEAANNPRCDDFATEPARVSALGKIRWDAGLSGGVIASDWTMGGGVSLGAARLIDAAYIFSLDVGMRTTLLHDFNETLAWLATAFVRWYPVKLQPALGVDECGVGRKNRRWSEHHDAAGYIVADLGYGHFAYGADARRDALGIHVGVGYDLNLSMKRSLFAEATVRFDVTGSSSNMAADDARSPGPMLQIGLRF